MAEEKTNAPIDAKRLLIVEDELELRESLARRFERKGFTVLQASGGHEAFDMLQDQNVDVVLTDIRMAKGMGTELLDRVRERFKDERPVVICMSGFSDLTPETARMRGADLLLPKPLEFLDLLAAIVHFTEERKQRIAAIQKIKTEA